MEHKWFIHYYGFLINKFGKCKILNIKYVVLVGEPLESSGCQRFERLLGPNRDDISQNIQQQGDRI